VPQPAALERGHDVVGVVHDEITRQGRTALPEHDLVVELGPCRHHEVAEPDQPGALDAAERPSRASLRQRLGLGAGHAEDAPGGVGDLLVAIPCLQVLLVQLGTR
jgi:hypothetical protein